MIVVDASAVLAIVLSEEDATLYQIALSSVAGALISSVNYWETLVGARRVLGQSGVDAAEALMANFGVKVVAPDASLTREAADAYQRFKGRSGGRLNLGDCFAYALAARESDGLLFKGNDFPKTDVRAVIG